MDDPSLSKFGLVCLEQVFREEGSVISPVVILEEAGAARVLSMNCPEDTPPEQVHQAVLSQLEALIRSSKISELFVGYEGFVLREETAVRVLVGAYYSDEHERFWVAQTHGSALGDWREAPRDPILFGFNGLWSRAKSHLRN